MHFAFSYAVHAALVSVDAETGEMAVEKVITAHDVGRAINPLSLSGQVEGGIVMGMGNALTEHYIVENGVPWTQHLGQYKMPGIKLAPQMENYFVEDATADGPYGAKGVGEIETPSPLARPLPTVCNAVGVRSLALPLDQDAAARHAARRSRRSTGVGAIRAVITSMGLGEKAVILARFAIRETMGIVLMGAALFWSAGEIGWPAAWTLIAVTAGWVVSTAIVILRYSPELLAERLGPRKGAKRWDTTIMGVYGLLQLAALIVAGLDRRYGWTAGFPAALQAIALAICVLGYALTVWATASNAYFSQIVRIQTDRGHQVATGGPYQYVRHPAYTGTILTCLAVPLLLASWRALAIGVAGALPHCRAYDFGGPRLMAELAGYSEYARHVRRRLIPHLVSFWTAPILRKQKGDGIAPPPLVYLCLCSRHPHGSTYTQTA